MQYTELRDKAIGNFRRGIITESELEEGLREITRLSLHEKALAFRDAQIVNAFGEEFWTNPGDFMDPTDPPVSEEEARLILSDCEYKIAAGLFDAIFSPIPPREYDFEEVCFEFEFEDEEVII